MVVVVMDLARRHKRFDGTLVTGCMTLEFAAVANSLIRLDMRAGGNLLQLHLHRLVALRTFEGQKTGWFVGHGDFSLMK